MKYQSTIIRQLLDFLPQYKFQEIVNKYQGDRYAKSFTCWHQLVSIFYAQLKQRTCLREIESGLDAQIRKLYHLGISSIKRSTLSDANRRINYRIYEDTFYFLLSKCKHITSNKLKFDESICSLDSTIIKLCYSLYPWAKYRTQKGGLKLHMRLDHNGYLPDFLTITDGKSHDLSVAKTLSFSSDSIVVFDRGYYSYAWFYALHKKGITFVSRTRKQLTYEFIGQHPIKSDDKNVLSDLDVLIPKKNSHEKRHYFEPIRLIRYRDIETGKIYRFLTNNRSLKAEDIAKIYKQRWKIELFFKWIKQKLIIKSFLGTSKNAVFSQIWISLILYLLIWYVKHQTRYKPSLTKLFRVLNEVAFERIPLLDAIGLKRPYVNYDFMGYQLALGFT